VPVSDVAADVQVDELAPGQDTAYEAFVATHPHALLYHSLRFRDFLVDLLGCRPQYGVARVGGEVVGVLPLASAPGRYGRVLNSLPYFGSNGGILAATGPAGSEARAALAEWYDGCAAAPGVAAATLIANPLDPDGAAPAHDVADVRVGCMTPLEGAGDPEERLLAAIDGSARRNVAKARRSRVEVGVDNTAFADLERLHRDGMEAIGGRAKTPAFFAAVPRCFRAGEDFDLYVARLDGDVVAALLVFFYGSVAEYYVPATNADSRPAQPMAAILHAAMTDAMRRGLRLWNWGGSWVSQENLVRFKVKWGGRPREYRYWTKVTNPDVLTAEPSELLAAYPGFFVAPFSSLRGADDLAG
jgi:CelD/BcsL family acetyltransferase involved in cellulose biosynthesis